MNEAFRIGHHRIEAPITVRRRPLRDWPGRGPLRPDFNRGLKSMLKTLTIAVAATLLFAVPALACTEISSKKVKLTGCVDDQWVAAEPGDVLEFSYLTSDQNFALQIVTESEVLAAQTLHDAILANAAAAVGNKPENVKVVSQRTENIDGKPFNLLEYTLTDGTNTLTYQNFFYSQPGFGTVQILVLSTAADVSAAGFKAGQFAGTVKLGG
jgi:hypothetical protein